MRAISVQGSRERKKEKGRKRDGNWVGNKWFRLVKRGRLCECVLENGSREKELERKYRVERGRCRKRGMEGIPWIQFREGCCTWGPPRNEDTSSSKVLSCWWQEVLERKTFPTCIVRSLYVTRNDRYREIEREKTRNRRWRKNSVRKESQWKEKVIERQSEGERDEKKKTWGMEVKKFWQPVMLEQGIHKEENHVGKKKCVSTSLLSTFHCLFFPFFHSNSMSTGERYTHKKGKGREEVTGITFCLTFFANGKIEPEQKQRERERERKNVR